MHALQILLKEQKAIFTLYYPLQLKTHNRLINLLYNISAFAAEIKVRVIKIKHHEHNKQQKYINQRNGIHICDHKHNCEHLAIFMLLARGALHNCKIATKEWIQICRKWMTRWNNLCGLHSVSRACHWLKRLKRLNKGRFWLPYGPEALRVQASSSGLSSLFSHWDPSWWRAPHLKLLRYRYHNGAWLGLNRLPL